MKSKYKRGKFPYTVKDAATGKLYVRKSVAVKGGKQKQIWRLCEPQTAFRVLEVLAEIEQRINTLKPLQIIGKTPVLDVYHK